MKWLIVILVLLLAGLQYRLWIGEGSLAQRVELQVKIEQYEAENDALRQRNRILALEVEALKNGLEGVEERAREQMGMIGKGETFYMIVKPGEQPPLPPQQSHHNHKQVPATTPATTPATIPVKTSATTKNAER